MGLGKVAQEKSHFKQNAYLLALPVFKNSRTSFALQNLRRR